MNALLASETSRIASETTINIIFIVLVLAWYWHDRPWKDGK